MIVPKGGRLIFRCEPRRSCPFAIAQVSVQPDQRRAEGVLAKVAAGASMTSVEM